MKCLYIQGDNHEGIHFITKHWATRWEELANLSDNIYLQYQSLKWWDVISTAHDCSEYGIVAGLEGENRLDSLAVVRSTSHEHMLCSRPFAIKICYDRCLEVLGSGVLGSCSLREYGELISCLFKMHPEIEACYFKSVRESSSVYTVLKGLDAQRSGYSTLFLEEGRAFYTINLPESFNEYLQLFKRKKRYNLKRQLRLLDEEGEGDVSLQVYCLSEDIARFADAVCSIFQHSWKAAKVLAPWQRSECSAQYLEHVAEKGLLRAYVLYKGDAPVAYVMGYQYGDVYHYSDIAFDDRYAHLSPGNSLLYLLVQDLIENSSARIVNFGIGDSEYKRNFANNVERDCAVVVWRHTPVNWLRALVARGAISLRGCLKRVCDREAS